MGDFTVDTSMQCFLCADPIILHGQDQPASLHSLQSLSQYIKIDMAKVFIEEENVPLSLLKKLKKAKLKVELCEECTHLNDMLSILIQRLSKIEMEVKFYLQHIHRNLMRAESENANNENSFKSGDPQDKEYRLLLEGKRQVASLLRSEVIQKCFPIICNTLPRIKVHKLTMKQVSKRCRRTTTPNSQMRCTNSSDGTLSIPVVESLQLKIEETDNDPLHDEDDDVGNLDLDYGHDPQSEDEESNYRRNPSESTGNFGNYQVSLRREPPKTYYIQNGKYNCTGCPKVYSTHSGFHFHYKSAHSKIPFKCKLCDLKFKFRTSLNRHHKTVHTSIVIHCNMCDKIFKRKDHLNSHFQHVHTKKKVKCQICSKSFSSKVALTAHLKANRCGGKRNPQ